MNGIDFTRVTALPISQAPADINGINLSEETALHISKAPAEVEKLTGTRPHRSTIDRWRLHGSRGVQLATFLAGGKRYTTKQAIIRFFEQVTAAGDSDAPPPVKAVSTNRRSVARANAELDAAGI